MSAPRHAIFISYRRRDSIYAVDRLDERLKHAFGADAVFRDVRSIRKGHDFPADIRDALDIARLGLVVIGPWWLKTSDDPDDSTSARRLDDPKDWVRIEIETLLQHGGVPVIPLLLGGADMPNPDDLPDTLRQLPHRDGMTLRPEPEFEDSVLSVIEQVSRLLGTSPKEFTLLTQVNPPRPPRVAPTRLSVTGREFVGRAKELHLLDEAWGRSHEDKINVISLVGQGGEGKTAIVLNWYARRAHRGWPGAARVFDWSFYSQGSSAQSAASADEFFARAFEWFGHAGEVPKDAWAKGEKLAELVAAERTLLVLDGLEPLQQPPGDFGGELKDPALKALLRGLAAYNPGLCVITTRADIADLRTFEGEESSCIRHQLHALDAEAARQLLRDLGVRGPDAGIDAAVREFHGHAYDLNLLGNFIGTLTDDHDIRRWREILLLKPDEHVHGKPDASGRRLGHGRRMLQAYERWLGPESVAASVLRLLGLFDRPARSDLLDELRTAPVIVGLTDALAGLPDEEWLRAVGQLQELALITREELGAAARPAGASSSKRKPVREGRPARYAVDTHPLLREHFAAELRTGKVDAWRVAHRRLYEYLRDTTEYQPNGLDGLQPLYQAVAHGCQAGLHQEASEKVYLDRIARGQDAYAVKKLGAFGLELGVVACFFEQPWKRAAQSLSEADQAWLLNQAAFCLRALGRLTEALEPMRAALDRDVRTKAWKEAAASAVNLTELQLTLGDVAGAARDAKQSVALADRSGDFLLTQESRGTFADVLHQGGRRADALARLRETEQMQAKHQPQYPLLYSLRGFRYCDLLLAEAERAAWQRFLNPKFQIRNWKLPDACQTIYRRAAQTLEWVTPQNLLLDIALDHLTLGRAALYQAILDDSAFRDPPSGLQLAHREFTAAVDGARGAGHQEFIVRGLLTRAWLQVPEGNPAGARADLDEAWQIAERGSMKLFLADVHLHRARLFRDKSELAKARGLIEGCGYWRRKEELKDAEAAAGSWEGKHARTAFKGLLHHGRRQT